MIPNVFYRIGGEVADSPLEVLAGLSPLATASPMP